MSFIEYTVRGGLDQSSRPDGVLIRLDFDPDELQPPMPTSIGTTTTSLDGRSGTTRLRGYVYNNRLNVPRYPIANLPLLFDFGEAMKFGYANPFFLDATDCFGQLRTQEGVVTSDVVDVQQISCDFVSFGFEFIEVNI